MRMLRIVSPVKAQAGKCRRLEERTLAGLCGECAWTDVGGAQVRDHLAVAQPDSTGAVEARQGHLGARAADHLHHVHALAACTRGGTDHYLPKA